MPANSSLDGTASNSAAFFKRCGAARQFKRYNSKMTDKEPLTSKTSNYIFIGIGLVISVLIILFLTPMFVSMIIALFQPETLDSSKILGMILIGLILLLLPIHLLSIVFRIKHIHTCKTGLYFNGQSATWNEINNIKIFLGNSGRFTVEYNAGNKSNKVFGSLLTFKRKAIIKTLQKIATENNIPISKWWL
ncbi:MAG: hypothetical protein SD837_00025 [Candidatus Electrothrix scaldis]|nr:MAG: hypothetical protein SD837_00025 [Candidatus Electrothrix sp. GW3-3]